jgi:hypothetical protein
VILKRGITETVIAIIVQVTLKRESMETNIHRNMVIITIKENIDQAVSSAPTVANEGALF